MIGHILLVEDDDSLREVMTFHLEDAGHTVEAVASGEEALAVWSPRVDLVMTDLRLKGIDGMAVLEAMRARDPQAVVLMVTAYGSAERAVEAMRRGAFHYVEKPVNTRALLAIVERALQHRRLHRENARLQEAVERTQRPTLVASSPAMNEVLRLVDKVAASPATVLILGESGTGKELVARAVHERSDRARRPFVTVNCAAIPGELLESTLFGHRKGAFTGAVSSAPGKFRQAHGGTIFLDEIGEMSPELQAKLLRVLQDGELEVVGESTPQKVDCRVIAATHQDLQAQVQVGLFRQDLYYRLNVVPIELPPLRQRPEDIPVLLRTFLRRAAPEAELTVTRAVDDALLAHSWPGNVRELKNIAERMVLLRDGDALTIDDLPPALRTGSNPSPGQGALPFALPDEGLDLLAFEQALIRAVLEKVDGNRSAAARYLNIPRHVLLYRLEKYGIN